MTRTRCYRRPFSIGWYALRPADSRIVRYREYYGCSGSPNEGLRLDPQVVAAKIRLIETHERARGQPRRWARANRRFRWAA